MAEQILDGSKTPLIRRATAGDLDALVMLRATMLEALNTPADFEPGWRAAFRAWAAERIDSPRFCMLLAELDATVVAGAQGELIEGQPGPTLSRRRVLITNVATVPAARGQGLGSSCLAAIIDWARSQGATSAVLNAAPMGLRVYLRAGFRPAVHPEYRLEL